MDSFQSFVDYGGFNESPPGNSNIDLRLLPNEIVSSQCNDCVFHSQFGESLIGRVYCTNVRLAFVPTVDVKSALALPRRSVVFDDFFDIPLVSIHRIYHSLSEGVNGTDLSIISRRKFKHMTSSVSSMEIISSLKLFLKDFRVITLDLSRSQNAANLANHTLHFSRPSGPQHIAQCTGGAGKVNREILFNRSSDWECELFRCGQKEGQHWRVLGMNKDGLYHNVMSYPMHVVVCAELFKHDLDHMIPNWKLGRFPIWVWSYSRNGTSLLRSSSFEPNQPAIECNSKLKRLVSRSHPPNDLPFECIVPDDLSPQKLAFSFEKLRRMCSLDSYAQLDSLDRDWLSRLHESQWPKLLSSCLRFAAEIVGWLSDRRRSVIIYEDEGRDFSAVISCLVQISMDPFFRTENGLIALIAKEFTALGHPFGDRSLGMAEDQTTPTFLLLIDCIHQLVSLYPIQFSYSVHFLIALWDLSLTGIVPGLTCNSVSDQLAYGTTGGPSPLFQYFTSEYSTMFRSVDYAAAQTIVTLKPQSNLVSEVIRPPTSLCDFRFFSECYHRWMPPTNIKNGGELSVYRRLDSVLNELIGLPVGWNRRAYNNEDDNREYSSAHPYSTAEQLHHNCLNRSIHDQSDTISLSQLSVGGKQRQSQLGLPDDSLSIRTKFSFKIPKRTPKHVPENMLP